MYWLIQWKIFWERYTIYLAWFRLWYRLLTSQPFVTSWVKMLHKSCLVPSWIKLKKEYSISSMLFVVCDSPARLSHREAEESTTMNWIEFLAEIENGNSSTLNFVMNLSCIYFLYSVHRSFCWWREWGHTLSLDLFLQLELTEFLQWAGDDRSNIFPTASTCSDDVPLVWCHVYTTYTA